MSRTANPFGTIQVCIIVEDLHEAMERYSSMFGIDNYDIYVVDTDELPGVTFRGESGDYRVEVALAQIGTWHLELLQHIRGDCTYKEFFDQYGEGVHHLGFLLEPENYDNICAELMDREIAHLQGGPILGEKRDGRFDYFDTKEELGVIVEMLDIPGVYDTDMSSDV